MQPCPSSCSCSSRWSSPGRSGRPTGATCCARSRAASPSTCVVLGHARRAPSPQRAPCLAPLAAGRVCSAAARRGAPATPEPATVATARATIVDPVSVSAERQAQAWLDDLDAEREVRARRRACSTALLHAHRIAAADPYIHEVSPAQALVIRAGWGEGEQVAYGRWLHARELPLGAATAAAARPAGGGCRRATARRRCAPRSASRSCSRRAARRCCARSSRCARAWTSTRAACATPRSSWSAPSPRRCAELRAEGRQDLRAAHRRARAAARGVAAAGAGRDAGRRRRARGGGRAPRARAPRSGCCARARRRV